MQGPILENKSFRTLLGSTIVRSSAFTRSRWIHRSGRVNAELQTMSVRPLGGTSQMRPIIQCRSSLPLPRIGVAWLDQKLVHELISFCALSESKSWQPFAPGVCGGDCLDAH